MSLGLKFIDFYIANIWLTADWSTVEGTARPAGQTEWATRTPAIPLAYPCIASQKMKFCVGCGPNSSCAFALSSHLCSTLLCSNHFTLTIEFLQAQVTFGSWAVRKPSKHLNNTVTLFWHPSIPSWVIAFQCYFVGTSSNAASISYCTQSRLIRITTMPTSALCT